MRLNCLCKSEWSDADDHRWFPLVLFVRWDRRRLQLLLLPWWWGGGGGWLDSIWWRISSPNVSVCSRSLGDEVKSIRYSEFDISCRREFIRFSKIWNQINKQRSPKRILFSSFSFLSSFNRKETIVRSECSALLRPCPARTGDPFGRERSLWICHSDRPFASVAWGESAVLEDPSRPDRDERSLRWTFPSCDDRSPSNGSSWFQRTPFDSSDSTETKRTDRCCDGSTERKRETFVRSALVNGGREITWRSSSARKTNSGWFSTKVRYLLDRRSIARNFFSPVKNALLESGDVISFFNFLCCSSSRPNCSSNSCAETLFSGFPSGTSAIWFGSLASSIRLPLIEFQSCVPIVANVRFLPMPSWSSFYRPRHTAIIDHRRRNSPAASRISSDVRRFSSPNWEKRWRENVDEGSLWTAGWWLEERTEDEVSILSVHRRHFASLSNRVDGRNEEFESDSLISARRSMVVEACRSFSPLSTGPRDPFSSSASPNTRRSLWNTSSTNRIRSLILRLIQIFLLDPMKSFEQPQNISEREKKRDISLSCRSVGEQSLTWWTILLACHPFFSIFHLLCLMVHKKRMRRKRKEKEEKKESENTCFEGSHREFLFMECHFVQWATLSLLT